MMAIRWVAICMAWGYRTDGNPQILNKSSGTGFWQQQLLQAIQLVLNL